MKRLFLFIISMCAFVGCESVDGWDEADSTEDFTEDFTEEYTQEEDSTEEYTQEEIDAILADTRASLVDLYNATGGDNWTNNDNWCSDKPISEWYGVYQGWGGLISNITLMGNGLVGSIPESIGDIETLTYLNLSSNTLTGSIPQSIGKLSKLVYLSFDGSVSLSGSIPESIGDLINLERLFLGGNALSGEIPESIGNLEKLNDLHLGINKLSGSIPESIGNLSNLTYLNLVKNELTGSIPLSVANLTKLEDYNFGANYLTGSLPESLQQHSDWNHLAWDTLYQLGDGFDEASYEVYLESTNVTTITGEAVNTASVVSDSELTCVVFWNDTNLTGGYYMETIKELYNKYKEDGFNMISMNDNESLSEISSYVSTNSIPGYVCQVSSYYYDYTEGTNRVKCVPTFTSPTYAIVDNTGKILFSESIYDFEDVSMTRENATTKFVTEFFGDTYSSSTDQYESSDYTQDGAVVTLQSATVGDGINIVIMGDGFVDTDMGTDGEYESYAKTVMEGFFSEEPYATYRDRFNVYTVKAISTNDGVELGNSTIFQSQMADDSYISGNDSRAFEYALKVPSISSITNLTVILFLNTEQYAGTCYMYEDGSSVSYCPVLTTSEEDLFRGLVSHESGGHGFAKLLDEYSYGDSGTITDDYIYNMFTNKLQYGWAANVDITNDPDKIQWAHFLSDSRYDGLVGIYEGAMTYEYGAYRPSEYSIMVFNTGGYNAPSREAIYKRIIEQSGVGTYSYENFVEYDSVNRSSVAQAQRAAALNGFDKSTFVPTAPPVFIKGSPKLAK